MVRLRLLLLCLLMWTVPLQGIAAVSMLFCVVGAGDSGLVETKTSNHSAHGHQIVNEATDKSSGDHKTLPDAAHKCGVCAACCSAALISNVPQTPDSVDLPIFMLSEPQVLIYAVPPRHPEKPPRA